MTSMYNRYTPQPDGSYRRNRVPESRRPPQQQSPQSQQQSSQPQRQAPSQSRGPSGSPPEPQPEQCTPPWQEQNRQKHEDRPKSPPCRQGGNVGSFLRNLLPKDFDTGDLVVVLLLLLMAGDCDEDRNTALLTLVLYLFL